MVCVDLFIHVWNTLLQYLLLLHQDLQLLCGLEMNSMGWDCSMNWIPKQRIYFIFHWLKYLTQKHLFTIGGGLKIKNLWSNTAIALMEISQCGTLQTMVRCKLESVFCGRFVSDQTIWGHIFSCKILLSLQVWTRSGLSIVSRQWMWRLYCNLSKMRDSTAGELLVTWTVRVYDALGEAVHFTTVQDKDSRQRTPAPFQIPQRFSRPWQDLNI